MFTSQQRDGGKIRTAISSLKREQFVSAMMYKEHLREQQLPNQDALRIMEGLLDAKSAEQYAVACIKAGYDLQPEFSGLAANLASAQEREKRTARAIWKVDAGAATPHSAVLHQSELDQLDKITHKLARSDGIVDALLIHTKAHSGCRFLLQNLHSRERFRKMYPGGVVHLRADLLNGQKLPSNGTEPNDLKAGLTSIYAPLSEVERYSASTLLKRLVKNRQLLVVHNLSVLLADPVSERPTASLINELAAEVRRSFANVDASPLLVVEWSSRRFPNTDYFRTHQLKVSIGPEEARKYFWEQMEFYKTKRGIESQRLLSNDWPRRKRIEWHYNQIGQKKVRNNFGPDFRTVTPASVRFRAICLSNAQNYSSHDATQGFNLLVGTDLLGQVPEVETIKEDITAHIRSAAFDETSKDAIRLISTGVYCFTLGMLARLRKALRHDDRLACLGISLTLDFVSPMNGRSDAFVLSLMVRAVVQDEWMRSGCEKRAQWHAAIADQLFDMSSSADIAELDREYPIRAPWNDVRMLFAAEAVRHYVRAAQSSQDTEERYFGMARQRYEGLGETFSFTSKSVDNPLPRKALSNATGQYRLKLELLGLLSLSGNGDRPALGLKMEGLARGAYYFEVGVTHAMLLNLESALQAFDTALKMIGEEKKEECAAARLRVRSQQVMALLETGDVSEAVAIQKLLRGDIKMIKGDELRDTENLRRVARAAAIAAAKGKRSCSLALFRSLHSPLKIIPIEGDRALGLIDTLIEPELNGRSNADDNMDQSRLAEVAEAWVLCEQLQSASMDEGNDFQNLRFETRRARIVRRYPGGQGCPSAGEAILERVGLLLEKYGGSEKEFKEFQIESASTLVTLGRPRYALAAYALPAWQQLENTSAEILKGRLKRVIERAQNALPQWPNESLYSFKTSAFWLHYNSTANNSDPFYSLPLIPSEAEIEKRYRDLGFSKHSESS